jgi:hypothetical protein
MSSWFVIAATPRRNRREVPHACITDLGRRVAHGAKSRVPLSRWPRVYYARGPRALGGSINVDVSLVFSR